MENVNNVLTVKSFVLAFVLLVFTYIYYIAKNAGGFVSLGAVIGFGIALILTYVIYFILIRLLGALILSEWVYPNLFFRTLIPFLLIVLVFWVVYGFVKIEPFAGVSDFMLLSKAFFTRHLLFIGISSTLIALVFSLPFQKAEPQGDLSFMPTLKMISGLSAAFILSVLLFYWTNKIAQPKLNADYAAYPDLKMPVRASGHQIEFLMEAGQYKEVGLPYVFKDKQELILNYLHSSSYRFPPLMKSFKIDKSGSIIDSLDAEGLLPLNEPAEFRDGFIVDHDRNRVVSWVFNGDQSVHKGSELLVDEDWKLLTMESDSSKLKLAFFYKQQDKRESQQDAESWRGTGYYHLLLGTDTLKFKIDNLIHSNILPKDEQSTLEYFHCKEMDFDLIRLNKRAYYIVKSIKK